MIVMLWRCSVRLRWRGTSEYVLHYSTDIVIAFIGVVCVGFGAT